MLIYDGDCAFCYWWARYWQRLADGRFRISAYQEEARHYPQIPLEEFRRAVQFVATDGTIASAAEASFLALSHARSHGFWLWCYRRLPGFAWLSEKTYAFFAAHRTASYRITRLLWGRVPEPPQFQLTAFIFLRLLGLIYLAAFASFAVQATGLIGADGILPLTDYLERIVHRYSAQAFLRYPMVFWIDASDGAIALACWAGAGVSLLLTCNMLTRPSLVVLFALYVSIFNAGQVFTIYQWDLLLLETGFLAILLTTGSRLAVFLLRWLLFRFMLLSGVVKLASGDTAWSELSVLTRYFETQPLPTPLAWYAHQLPESLLVAAAALMFAIELALPFLIFLPRRPRFVAAWGFIVFQLAIIATGNYNFFNLLTIALCVLLFDDQAIRKLVADRSRGVATARRPTPLATGAIAVYAIVVVLVSSGRIVTAIGKQEPPALLAGLTDISPLRIINPYGAFAEIVTERQEIIVEATVDGREWREYEFKYKPGDVARAPGFSIPHQPRLDWQMWFAAIGNESRGWFPNFLNALLAASPDVLALIERDPFPGEKPKSVRAMLYTYRFATPEDRAKGLWWERQQTGIFYPALSADHAASRAPAQRPPLFESLIR